jgi:hypothetical protein
MRVDQCKGLSVQNVARDGNCLFSKFRPFLHFILFIIICSCLVIKGRLESFPVWKIKKHMVVMSK